MANCNALLPVNQAALLKTWEHLKPLPWRFDLAMPE